MSKKNVDHHNRLRSKIVSFRMSPEEAKLLDDFVSVSGLNKQDYLISRVLQRDVIVQGNPRVYKALRNELTNLTNELQNASQLDDEFLLVLKQSLDILSDMKICLENIISTAGRKGTFDAKCQKCFCITLDKSNRTLKV